MVLHSSPSLPSPHSSSRVSLFAVISSPSSLHPPKGKIPHQTLVSAFGPTSLGILLVRDLPPAFPHLRARVLSNASHLAHLPASKLEYLTNERAKYLVGWSHGKETLRPGVVDQGKGSYYVNCGFYQEKSRNRNTNDGAESVLEEGDDEQKRWKGFEEYTAPNIWPDEEDIPGFQESAEEMITLIIDVAVLVSGACDRYAIKAVEGYEEGYLERVVKTSTTTKARLLHYFPAEEKEVAATNGDDEAPNGDDKGDRKETDEDDWPSTQPS